MPNGLAVVVHPDLLWVALEAISSSLVANAKNVMESACQVISFPDVTTDQINLFKTNVPVKPFIFQDRIPVSMDADEGTPDAAMRGKFLYGARGRYAIAYGRWEYAVRVKAT